MGAGGRTGTLLPCPAPAVPVGWQQPRRCFLWAVGSRHLGLEPEDPLCSCPCSESTGSHTGSRGLPRRHPNPPAGSPAADHRGPTPHPSTSVRHDSRTRLPPNVLMLACFTVSPDHMFVADNVASTPGHLPRRSTCDQYCVISGLSPSCMPLHACRHDACARAHNSRGSRAAPTLPEAWPVSQPVRVPRW